MRTGCLFCVAYHHMLVNQQWENTIRVRKLCLFVDCCCIWSRHVPIVLGNFWATFCVWSNVFRFEQLQATFSFLSNFSLEFKLYSMKCLHVIDNFIFLLLTSKDPGYEVASFSVIFFYLIFKFFYDLCFVICKTFVKKMFSLYNSKQFIRAYGNCIKLLINVCREINVKSTKFLNFSSNFFCFWQLWSNFYAF
jgi:hypothetical protein